MRNLYKILVVASSYVDFSLPVGIVTYYYVAYSVIYAVSDNHSGGYAHCVIYAGIALPQISGLPSCYAFKFLLVLDALKPCIFSVVQAIVRFDLFPIDYKRCPFACYRMSQGYQAPSQHLRIFHGQRQL